MTRIPLPAITQSIGTCKGHSYPFQIGLQAMEFMNATFFYMALQDFAAGAQIKKPGGIGEIELEMLGLGLEKESLELGWKCLSKYSDVFKESVIQGALVALNSHWDWYVRKITEFVIFGRSCTVCAELAKKQSKDLRRIGSLPLLIQLDILSIAAGAHFAIDPASLEDLKEMSLVRNIGLHNRWEVDRDYLSKSAQKKYGLGEIRNIEIQELYRWYQVWLSTILRVTSSISVKFTMVPKFPIAES